MPKLLPFLPLFDQPDVSEQPEAPTRPETAVTRPGPPDAEARSEALDTRRSFIVEAPAGSGKTGLLIQRLLKLLADPSVEQPEQVLAITFTVKATNELRDRVLAHLAGAAQSTERPGILNQLAAGVETAPALDGFEARTRALALAVLERDRQLGWSLLERPHRLNIRTIDSVCAQIARTLPVLSGSGGRLIPTPDAGSLHREATRRTLLLFGGSDPAFNDALQHLLLHRDGNLAGCESLIANMLGVRDQWGDLLPLASTELDDAWLDSNALPRLQLALEEAICAGLAPLAQAFPPDLLADLADLAGDLGHARGYREGASPIAHCAGIHDAPAPCHEDLERWRALIHLLMTPSTKSWRKRVNANDLKINIQKHHVARLTALIDSLSGRDDLLPIFEDVRALPPAQYPADQWAMAKSRFRVLSRALVELQLVFAAHNQCDFTELGLLARQALRQDSGPEDLAAALGARLQHLLVDEMQDTSTSQYELLERLTASWDGHSQTVFLVGDPRQSIYLFRQARVERFIRAMHSERLGDLPLTHLRLTANFRSQRALIDRFNVEFPLIFPSSTGRQPAAHDLPYGPAIATLPPSPHAAGVTWHINPVGASSQAAGPVGAFTPAQLNQQQAQQDAREIRRIAGRWLARPLPPGRRLLPDGRPEPWRIAVLVRGRSHLVEIVTALKQQEEPGPVPFRAVEIEPLTERQEVLDLTALTRALLHPGDRVAGLALLRAPWCGLALPELHALAAGDDPAFKQHSIQRLLADRAHLLPGEFRQRAAYVADVLQTAANLRARLTTAQLVERAWRTLGGDTWLNATELANARRYLQLLDAIEASNGRIDLALLNQRLEKLHAEPETLPPGTAHVELLTIHNAKGLEWDVVLVPALERKPAQGASRLLTWAEFDSPDSPDPATGRPAHIMLAPIRGRGDAAKPLNDWLRRIQNQREAAECKRLFYVACTRAREELHLFAAPELRASGTFTPNYSSLLKAAWPAAQLHFHAKVQAGTGATLPDGAQGVASRKDNQQSAREPAVLDIAAAATAAAQAPILQRLPLDFDPAARFIEARARAIPCGVPDVAGETRQFDRPEGSFAVRSFGNVVHALLEVLAARTAAGCDVKRLIVELPAWTPRIAALLRADGLPSGTVNRLTRETLAALQTTLRDPDGLWLLTAHPGAASELALTAWSEPREPTGMAGAQATSIRIDRIFEAGSEPRAASPGSGEAFLWIVDYKTTSHGPTGLEGFLTRQRAAYAPQLEAYARILAPARSTSLDRIRLALYYPAIPRLDWWKPV